MRELLDAKKEILNAGHEIIAGYIGKIKDALSSCGFEQIGETCKSETAGEITCELKAGISINKQKNKTGFKKPFILKTSIIRWEKKKEPEADILARTGKLIDVIIMNEK